MVSGASHRSTMMLHSIVTAWSATDAPENRSSVPDPASRARSHDSRRPADGAERPGLPSASGTAVLPSRSGMLPPGDPAFGDTGSSVTVSISQGPFRYQVADGPAWRILRPRPPKGMWLAEHAPARGPGAGPANLTPGSGGGLHLQGAWRPTPQFARSPPRLVFSRTNRVARPPSPDRIAAPRLHCVPGGLSRHR